ncbi:methylenetetrahydrofolate reductase [NAD(P)H] [Candidatus Albibeggiatoa sp. nov. NOAA]|uniref:methylenetetrahydrofolate reductase [NAD(P)H] n=1 Tax=Candidatus Albibeggiatoa sp. nov. NOAA TaxID=3162724 RepID=UPI003303827F|nr:methylenetetrahydrofolate reductase [NAD(P)H] [Thiotrichaceae bacterium]
MDAMTIPVSCEFFPPRTDKGMEKLKQIHDKLKQALNPEYFSVTFGAGGSTQEKTFETVNHIQQAGSEAAPHLSCIASTKDNIRELLQNYKDSGISRIVALRGDKPSGWLGSIGEFSYANELVTFIREETGDHFHLEVAAYPEFHPQSKSAATEFKYFQQKVEAGANAAITQYFYNVDSYFQFMDECQKRGIDIPVVPGIMPISNFEQLVRFSDTCGADIPRWLRWKLDGFQDDGDSLQEFAADFIAQMCERLIQGGAPSLHFYTLNKANLTLNIARNIGLTQ